MDIWIFNITKSEVEYWSQDSFTNIGGGGQFLGDKGFYSVQRKTPTFSNQTDTFSGTIFSPEWDLNLDGEKHYDLKVRFLDHLSTEAPKNITKNFHTSCGPKN